MSSSIFDVAIVGCGPTGVTLANLLGHAGLKVLVLDKEADIIKNPRAIHCDAETMRVLHSLGLREELDAISRPGRPSVFVNAEGETLMVRNATGDIGVHGIANSFYYHQPELENVLRQGLKRYPDTQLQTSQEVIRIQDGPEVALLDVRDESTGKTWQAKARYVVGSDGGRSLARKTLDCAMMDLGMHQPWVVFDVILNANAPKLPEHTVQHCNPARPMTYCNVIGERRRWEIMLLPGEDPATMAQPKHVWPLVEKWLSPEQAHIERCAAYTFHALIARGWRKGRILLAGDAAHQTPPFMGQGLCAGIRDAANLAWKLEMVIHGKASPTLLDSYESERSPHVQTFIELAVRLGEVVQTTDPESAKQRDAMFREKPDVFIPPYPRLGAGVYMRDDSRAGYVFPQPRLQDGRLLDEHLGHRFTVIGDVSLLDQADEKTRTDWTRLDAVLVPASGELSDWLDANQCRAVVLRPDRYIVGTASTPQQLAAITACLVL